MTLFPRRLLYRKRTTTLLRGVWVDEEEDDTFMGSIQPVAGKQSDEETTTRDGTGTVKIYTQTKFNIGDRGTGNTAGDLIEFDGRLWEITRELKNDNSLLPHRKYIASYYGEIEAMPEVIDTDHYAHLGTSNVVGGMETGLVPGTEVINRDDEGQYNPLRFNDNLESFKFPPQGSYDPNTGNMILPRGHWLVCASLTARVVNSGQGNANRLLGSIGIVEGNNLRHVQGFYARNNDSFLPEILDIIQGQVSVAGAYFSTGNNPMTIQFIHQFQDDADTGIIQGAHVHCYQQLVGIPIGERATNV